jgi:alanine dehydrogenase
MPYALAMAGAGWEKACRVNAALARGVNITRGKCTRAGVAEAQGLDYTPLGNLLGQGLSTL